MLPIEIVDAGYGGSAPKGPASPVRVTPPIDAASGSPTRTLYHQGEEARMRALTWGRGAALITAISIAAHAVAQTKSSSEPKSTQRGSTLETNVEARVNNWTVGLASGLPEGTILRFAAEIARNLNDGEELRILPIVTPGAANNLNNLLYLKGVDLAIVHSDVLQHFQAVEKIPNIEKRVQYISPLQISELHVVVRPEVNSFQDLEGKKVSFNTEGAGPSITGPILFQRLGVHVDPVYINNAIALERMKSGEIVALLHTVGKPNELLRKFKNEYGFKFLAVPFEKFSDLYVPSFFTAEDYPDLVKPGTTIETIGVQAVLAVYNWSPESDRFRRVSRFIDYYFDRFDNFHQVPYHPQWKSINPAAKVRGWTRYWVAEQKLKQLALHPTPPARIDTQLTRQQAERVAPNDPAEQERLFREFLEWDAAHTKR
jgi:TRAP transporter TAXI family solute receptor